MLRFGLWPEASRGHRIRGERRRLRVFTLSWKDYWTSPVTAMRMTFVSFQHRRSTNKIIVDYYQRFTCFDRIGYYLSRKVILALIQRGAIHILLANISPEYRNYICRSLNRNKETLLSSPVLHLMALSSEQPQHNNLLSTVVRDCWENTPVQPYCKCPRHHKYLQFARGNTTGLTLAPTRRTRLGRPSESHNWTDTRSSRFSIRLFISWLICLRVFNNKAVVAAVSTGYFGIPLPYDRPQWSSYWLMSVQISKYWFIKNGSATISNFDSK